MSKARPRWRTLNHRYLHQSPWFSVRQEQVRLPNDDQITYTFVDHPGYVLIVPVLDDGRVVMERVYRHVFDDYVLECPSGGRDGDAPEAAARRELEEETGYVAESWQHLGAFAGSAGMSNEVFDVFVATELAKTGALEREPTEQIEIELIPFADLREMALRGEVLQGPGALAILLASEALKIPPG